MPKFSACITGVEGYLPDYVLTNAELETMVDTTDEWITSRTGIKERRILRDKNKSSSDMATIAINKLLEKKNISPEEIDLVICATITGDLIFPSTANIISDKVGIRNAFSFDLSAACSGFLYGLEIARKFAESGTHKKILVVGVEKMSSIINYKDRNTCIIFGDGCGVVLVEPSEDKSLGIQDSILKSDGMGRQYLHQKAGGSLTPPTVETIENDLHYVFQDGKHVFKHAVSEMANVSEELLLKNNLTGDDIDWLVPHQANLRIIEAARKRINLAPEKVMLNIERYGNTTAGTLPLCLWDYEKQLKKGDKVVLTTFGAGFTWGAMYLKWAY